VSQLPDEEASRWNAARWHLSQAVADWAEDSHTAAAHVWQALEAFSPKAKTERPLTRVVALISGYLRTAVPEMGRFLATRLSFQAHELGVIGYQCDWYRFDARKVPFEKWMSRALDSSSANCYVRWRAPIAPRVLFDEAVGLLWTVNRRLKSENSEPWMNHRLRADLGLLYGVRNKAVHSGQRVLSRRTARYLGQLGIELLLAVMARRAAELREAS